MFAKFIEESSREIIVQSKVDYNAAGQWSMIAGVGLGIIIIGLYLFFQVGEILIIMMVPGACLLIGFIFTLVGTKTVFHKTGKEITHKGSQYSYHTIDSVMINSSSQALDQDESQRFFILLVQKDSSGGLTDKIDQLNKFSETLSNEEITEEKEQELIETIKEHHMRLMELMANAIILGDHYHEMIIWQAAEKIAKELNVPLTDTCGENMLYRQPHELDLSLKQRLQRSGEKRELPENKPDGVEVDLKKGFTIMWEHTKATEIGFLAAAFLGFSAGGYYFGSVHPLLGMAFYAPALFMAVLIWFLMKGHGSNKFTIANDTFLIEKSYSKPETIPLSEIETLRINSGVNKSINIMTDHKLFRLQMKTEYAEWIVNRVEYYLLYGK